MEKIIWLNAGHDEVDPGAISKNRIEREINIAIRDKLKPELENQGFKVEVVPDNLNLIDSIDWVNKRVKNIESGLALSIHQNCCSGSGAETYYYSDFNSSKKIAKLLIDEFCKETGIRNRGAKPDSVARWGRLGWIRNTDCWATLIECGFIDNDEDMKKIMGDYDLMAKGIAKGVCKIYGIKYKEKQSPPVELPKGREEIKKQIIKLVNQL